MVWVGSKANARCHEITSLSPTYEGPKAINRDATLLPQKKDVFGAETVY